MVRAKNALNHLIASKAITGSIPRHPATTTP